MSNSLPGGFANGAVKVLFEPTQTAPQINGSGNQNPLPEVTTLKQSVHGAQGIRKRSPSESGLQNGQNPL